MWVSTNEAAKFYGVTPRAIRIAVSRKSKKYQYRYIDGIGGNRGRVLEIYITQDKKEFNTLTRLTSLDDSYEKKDNFMKLDIDDLKDENKMKRAEIAKIASNCPVGKKKDEWVKEVAKEYGLSTSTLYRDIKKYTTTPDSKKKVELEEFTIDFKEFRSFSSEALEWSVGYRLKNPLVTKENIFTELKKEALLKDWKIGSVKRFYVAMKKIPQALLIRSTGGVRALDNNVIPTIKRDLSHYDVLELIVGDQNILDWYVFDDNGDVITPELYMWVDMRSGFICGLAPTLGKYNKYLIGDSLKQVCKYGIPKNIYTDNGKPELSGYIKDIRKQLKGVSFKRLDEMDWAVGHTKAKVRNSKAKPIESYFNHIQRRLRDQVQIGYKKYLKDESDEVSQDRVKKEIKEGRLLHYKVFFEELASVVKWWNTHLISTRKIVPEIEFMENIDKSNLVHINDDILDYLFLPAKIIKVRNSKVTFTLQGQKITYYSPKLGHYYKQSVEVRVSLDDIDVAYIVDCETNRLIDKAYIWEAINPKDQEQLKEKIKLQSRARRAWSDISKHYTKQIKNRDTLQLVPYAAVAKEVKGTKDREKPLAMTPANLQDALLTHINKTG